MITMWPLSTQGWVAVMPVSLLTPVTIGSLYRLMFSLTALTCPFLNGRFPTSLHSVLALLLYLFSPCLYLIQDLASALAIKEIIYGLQETTHRMQRAQEPLTALLVLPVLPCPACCGPVRNDGNNSYHIRTEFKICICLLICVFPRRH